MNKSSFLSLSYRHVGKILFQPQTFEFMSSPEQDILSDVLQPVFYRIADLESFIELAKTLCRDPSEHGLTKHESAAIYLYTIQLDNGYMYQLIEKQFQKRSRSNICLWIEYLKFLDSALMKLPSLERTVWVENENFPWWYPFFCTTETEQTESIGYRINVVNAKSIKDYSSSQEENQFLIPMGTRFSKIFDQWQEIEDDSTGKIRHINQYREGEVYLGDWINNAATGFGHVIFPNGNIYQGEWYHNQRHGQGLLQIYNGDRYESNQT